MDEDSIFLDPYHKPIRSEKNEWWAFALSVIVLVIAGIVVVGAMK